MSSFAHPAPPRLDGEVPVDAEPRGNAASLAAAGLAVAGVLFVVYPALRPYSSETGMEGARAFASWQWAAAHLCGIVAFVLLGATVARLGLGRRAPIAIGLGSALVLPYYGAEVFGVGAVGQRAVTRSDPGLLDAVDDIRYGAPAMTIFAIGLLLLAVGGVAVAVATWRRARAAGLLVMAGLVLYLPQFFLPGSLRIAHGAVLGLGLVLLAAGSARRVRLEEPTLRR